MQAPATMSRRSLPFSGKIDRPAPARYSRLSRALHWITAVLIFALVPLGLWGHWLGRTRLHDVVLDGWHKPLGLLVILLTLVRLAVSTRASARPGHGNLRPWEVAASRAGHAALYALLLLLPLSGVLMSEGAGRTISFFGLFTLPQVVPLEPGIAPPQQYWFRIGHLLHTNIFDWALYAVFAAHIAGVIKHQLIDGDRGFIGRMWSLR